MINESYFCVLHKNRRKHNQHFRTAVFHKKFTLCQIKPNIYIQKTKFASHKEYLFCVLTCRNAKKTQTDQSIPLVFLFCLETNNWQTFKSDSCKKPFSPVCTLLVKLALMNIFYSMWWLDDNFSWKFIVLCYFWSAM